jgi:uncharacterized protein involved in exopolysaccharide biosynthesis
MDIKSQQEEGSEIDLKELFLSVRNAILYLKSKWVVIGLFILLGSVAGFLYAFRSPVLYNAKLTFALEEEKGSNGLSGAMGLASSLGFDLGGSSAGGAFSGSNLIELMKSRLIIEKTLLKSVNVNGKQKTLADFYMEITKQKEDNPQAVYFSPNIERSKFTLLQDSILGRLYESIVNTKGMFSVGQKDKKISIITIETQSTNEQFAKEFSESMAAEVSDFYIDTKSKKAKLNLEILQHQTDSVRAELNQAITGVAVANDNAYNLNPAISLPKTTGARRQIDVQANSTILSQLIANLEMAKVALRKETPLIQIIDKPIYPLTKIKVGKIKTMASGGILAFIFISTLLLADKWRRRYLSI